MKGTGEFIRKECARLVDTFADANADHYDDIRQDTEYHYQD